MGSTSHHNRWQIAKKIKGEIAETGIKDITWQTGRTGRITPVIEVEPTSLSGATISRVTAHHAGMVKLHNLSPGTTISIIRSGEVIPKFLSVTEKSEDSYSIPTHCPSCEAPTEYEGDFLICTGTSCPSQIESRLLHFFDIIGNIDLFGEKTISKLVSAGFDDLLSIYAMTQQDFFNVGFGVLQSQNLVNQLLRSRTEAVEDWRFLGAMGIHHLGRGDSRKLLKAHPLETINTLTPSDLMQIKGFGDITSVEIPEGIQAVWPTIKGLLQIGFNLTTQQLTVTQSAITGKHIVFTGTMSTNRKGMEEFATQFGANVQKSVNKKTDILVIGANVGATKIEKAEQLGTKIMPEAEYLEMIG